VVDKMSAIIDANPRLHWSIVQRGFWVNGVSNLREFFAATEEYKVAGRGAKITCPTLIAVAENDPLAASYASFVDALGDKATVLHFTAAEGAGDHCEMFDRV
jgi:pimeloyl-ACP methyl ester carboxylesterase